MTLTVIDVHSGQPHDVVITADPAGTVGDAAAAIRAALRGPDTASLEGLARVVPLSRDRTPPEPVAPKTGDDLLWLGSRALDPELALRDSPLFDGRVVRLGAPGPNEPTEPTGVVELRVAGGPAAGGAHRLGLGEWTVGLAPTDGVSVTDPALADEHLRVVVGPASVRVVPMSGRVVLREGQPVPGQGVGWQPGELIEAGNTLLALDQVATPTRPDGSPPASGDGGLTFHRTPRPPFDSGVRRLQMPGNPAGSPRDKKAASEYAAALAQFNADLWTAAHHDALDRRRQCPDPAELLLTALGPRRRLWERRPHDPDALRLRLGVRSLPARIELTGPDGAQMPPPVAWSVPVTVGLRELGVLGVAGPAGPLRALARWLLVQAAVLHSPRELSIVVFAADGWEWVRWLPHLRPRCGQDAAILVGNDAETATRRAAELTTLIAVRSEAVRSEAVRGEAVRDDRTTSAAPCSQSEFAPVIVLLDGGQEMRRLAGMRTVLSRGPAVGVFAICLDSEEHLLPEECHAIVGYARQDPTRLNVATVGAEERRDVLADQVSVPYARRVARGLAPLRDGNGNGNGNGNDGGSWAPAAARLLERLDLDPPTAERIASGWRQQRASTTVVVGGGPDGELSIDLRHCGPHCLVTGAPGAGKSELLRVLIAALAVANRPDAFTFILIDGGTADGNRVDGGGGAGFADCAELPHTVAVITDPDAHIAASTVRWLTAEVRRREQLLAGAEAADIDDMLAGAEAGDRSLPRLMIVIDELTPLARKLPDFVTRLVDIARRGQAAGLHLVVATADPAEAIFADVAAIANVRIALRMTDESQSRAVIDAPDAAQIDAGTPGRGYVRIGTSTPVPFQLPRVTSRRPSGGSGTSVTVTVMPWAAAGRPLPPPPTPADDPDRFDRSDRSERRTDLAALVAAIRAAAEQLDMPPASGAWLPPLPDVVTIDEVASGGEADGSGRLTPGP